MIKRHLFLPLVDQALVSGSAFVSTLLIARRVSIDEFGIFATAWMIVLFVAGIQSALILFPMMSLGPQKSGVEKDKFFSDLTSQQIVFAVFCAIIMAVCAFPLGLYILSEPVPISFALALGAVGGITQIQEFQRRLLFTEGKPVAALIGDGIRYGGQVALLALAFQFGLHSSADILWVLSASAAAAVVAFPGYMMRARLEPRNVLRQFQRNWHFSSWLLGSSLLTGVTNLVYVMLTGFLLGPAAVGASRAAAVIAGISGVFLQALQNVIPMHAARRYASDGAEGLASYLFRMGFAVTTLIGIFGLVLAAAPEFWLGLAYGPKYDGYSYVLVWTAAIYYVTAFEFPLSVGLRTTARTRPSFVAYLAGAACTLASIYPLAIMYGLVGVLGGLTVAMVVQNIILLSGLRIVLREKKSASIT